ncbi:hypothetical protein CEN47_08175, partial [Fischerella thermalis CCMEE 5319]
MKNLWTQLYRSNKFMSLMGNGSAALLGLLSFALLARSLERDELGIWVFFMTVFTLFDMIRSGLLSNALIKRIGESDTDDEKHAYTGAAWRFGLWLSAGISLPISLFFILFPSGFSEELVFVGKWFWLISIISHPNSISIWLLNAYNRFDRLFWARSISQFVYFLGCLFNFLYGIGLELIVWSYIGGWLAAGVFTALNGWNGIQYFFKGSKEHIRSLYDFGKYSMGTLLGSNLLKSTDTFLLMFFMGPAPVARYNVPERLLGLLDIPIRSLVSTAYPKLISVRKHMGEEHFLKEYEVQTGLLFLLVLPIALVTLMFSDQLVVILAGRDYMDASILLKIFAIYTALIPLDRLSGIALEVFDLQKQNFYKVMLMALVNVLGDVVAIKVFKSVTGVALVSIFTYGSGILFGYYFLGNKIKFRPLSMLYSG